MHKALIIGLGRIAWQFDEDPKRNYVATHAAAYTKNPQFKLVAAADVDAGKRSAFARREDYRDVHCYEDYREAVKKERPDVVSICTPPATHAEILKFCLSENIPVVFCEKPLARDSREVKMIRNAAAKSKSVVCVNHSRRWHPLHRAIADEMKGFGTLQNFQAFYTAGLFNTGTHLFDLLNWFFGRPQKISAVMVREKEDPDVTTFLTYPDGVCGAVFALNVQSYLIFEIDAYFSDGRIRILQSGKEARVWRGVDSPNFSGYRELQEAETRNEGFEKIMTNAVLNIHGILEGREAPACGLEDGIAVVEWLEQIAEAARAGREITR